MIWHILLWGSALSFVVFIVLSIKAVFKESEQFDSRLIVSLLALNLFLFSARMIL
jgi:hypothetical protein